MFSIFLLESTIFSRKVPKSVTVAAGQLQIRYITCCTVSVQWICFTKATSASLYRTVVQIMNMLVVQMSSTDVFYNSMANPAYSTAAGQPKIEVADELINYLDILHYLVHNKQWSLLYTLYKHHKCFMNISDLF